MYRVCHHPSVCTNWGPARRPHRAGGEDAWGFRRSRRLLARRGRPSSVPPDDGLGRADCVPRSRPVAGGVPAAAPWSGAVHLPALAASAECTKALVTPGATAVAYETGQPRGRLTSSLAPMSQGLPAGGAAVGAHLPGAGCRRSRIADGRWSPGYAAKVVRSRAGVSVMNAASLALACRPRFPAGQEHRDLRQSDRLSGIFDRRL